MKPPLIEFDICIEMGFPATAKKGFPIFRETLFPFYRGRSNPAYFSSLSLEQSGEKGKWKEEEGISEPEIEEERILRREGGEGWGGHT